MRTRRAHRGPGGCTGARRAHGGQEGAQGPGEGTWGPGGRTGARKAHGGQEGTWGPGGRMGARRGRSSLVNIMQAQCDHCSAHRTFQRAGSRSDTEAWVQGTQVRPEAYGFAPGRSPEAA